MNISNGFNDFTNFFQDCFRSHSLQIILGSGFSSGERAENGYVPNGSEYKNVMLSVLKKNSDIPADFHHKLEQYQFKDVAEYYEDDQYVSTYDRKRYYNDNFTNVKLSAEKRKILEIDWLYVYTLNIDDAIENNGNYEVVYANRPVEETIYDQKKCVIKLHGDVHDIITYKDSNCKIFTSSEYIKSIKSNISLLNKLQHDYMFQNILFLGCSLTDELDILSLNIYDLNDNRKSTKKIIILDKEPDFEYKHNLKKYGITDIIISDFSTAYNKIYELWIKSQQTRSNELAAFKDIKVNSLSKEYDIKNKQINIPYYFINREFTTQILNLANNTGIILIQGNSISGKTYCLIDIYISSKEKTIYYFDSRIRLNDDTFKMLFTKSNSIFLFDVGAMTREQFEHSLLNSEMICNSNNCFIFMISSNNSDLLGIVKFKLQNKEIPQKNIKREYLVNKLTRRETIALNKKLPIIHIPAFLNGNTLLDNLIYIHRDSLKKGRFKNTRLEIKDAKMLELCILLATREKLYSSDVVRFGLASEIIHFVCKYQYIIDEINSDLFERSPSDSSPVKYILNAKFWLHTELGQFARNPNNLNLVTSAYLSIINTIRHNETLKPYKKTREEYREFTLFDTINTIFFIPQKQNLQFIINLYEKLHSELATDYQFLHQFAKGYLMYSYSLNDNQVDEKLEILKYASEKIEIAQSILNNDIYIKQASNSNTENNEITLAHMNFTKALINCEKTLLNQFQDITMVSNALEILYLAFLSPYNRNNFQNRYDYNQTINNFITKIVEITLDNSQKNKINTIRNYILKTNAYTDDV